jgi:hypothetical protein
MKVKESYIVYILQATGEPLEVHKSENFAECKTIFDKLELELEKARKTKGALFKLRDPFILSCDPQFIVRISLVPRKDPIVTDVENPYQKRMLDRGFAATMKNPLAGELMDEGYKD